MMSLYSPERNLKTAANVSVFAVSAARRCLAVLLLLALLWLAIAWAVSLP
ncbi:TPA: hypothetical protein PPN70_000819 [Serratia rubidaea]|nr:hypothetical protein [Serratia rubidaea]HDJ1447595.1 hypothetical protein [Serratia rubidaea]HDJ1462301.1 hypothetical protein [Serratia rubidaea]HDJ2770476.1 hypothetical protein [Serratia rubidaea]